MALYTLAAALTKHWVHMVTVNWATPKSEPERYNSPCGVAPHTAGRAAGGWAGKPTDHTSRLGHAGGPPQNATIQTCDHSVKANSDMTLIFQHINDKHVCCQKI